MSTCFIIVNWNGCVDTIKCIESINSNGIDNDIYIVDNLSSDYSVERIVKKFEGKKITIIDSDAICTPDIRNSNLVIIKSRMNGGFSYGNNLALKIALRYDYKFFWFINSDAYLKKDSINKYLDYKLEEKNPAIYGTKILEEYDENIIQSIGGSFNNVTFVSKHNFNGVLDSHISYLEPFYKADYAVGASFIVNRSYFEKFGLFDDRYFLFHEEIDSSRKINYNVKILTTVSVIHKGGGTTNGFNKRNFLTNYYFLRGRIIFSYGNGLLNLIWAIFLNIISIVRRFNHRDYKLILSSIKATFDGIRISIKK